MPARVEAATTLIAARRGEVDEVSVIVSEVDARSSLELFVVDTPSGAE